MAILHDFEYFRPDSLKEALKLLADHKDAAVLAGGTDLVGEMKEEMRTPPVVIDIKALKDLREIRIEGDRAHIGAGATFSEMIDSSIINESFPLIMEAVHLVGSVGVRNRATMAGNICSAVPCMDSATPLLVFDAEVRLQSQSGERTLPIQQWFKGVRRTAIKPGEILTRIELPVIKGKNGSAYLKLGRYSGEDLAQASVAVLALENGERRIAFGAVAPTPIRAGKIEELVSGKELNDTLIAKAMDLVPSIISPITDVRASKEYRMHMCRVMLDRGLRIADDRLKGKGPKYGMQFI